MSLKQVIFSYLLNSKDSSNNQKQFVNWNQLSTILIIAYDNQLSNCVDFINACKKDNISINVVVIYEGKIEQAPQPNFEHVLLDKKQFNFIGIPKEEALQKLNSKTVDCLINLGEEGQLKALGLSKLVGAKCKIGNFKNTIFDITIEETQSKNASYFLQQVIVYLNMIKTK